VIRAASNGYVIVDPLSTEGTPLPGNFAADYTPTVAEFLGAGPTNLARFAPFWHDFSPNKNAAPLPFSDPLAGLHIVNHLAGSEVLITWYRVGRYNSVGQVFQEEHTMQCSLNWATGIVEFRYGLMGEIHGDTFSGQVNGITGFSRGNILGVSSVNPQSRDLSIERPFATQVEGATGNVGLVSRALAVPGGPIHMGRAFVGQSVWWDVSNVPATTIIGVTLIDIAALRPGLQGPPIFPLGSTCMLSVTPLALVQDVHFPILPAMPGINALPIPAGYQPALMGLEIFAQFVGLDFAPLANVSSNAIRHVIGNN
jgi:hypothetical protein